MKRFTLITLTIFSFILSSAQQATEEYCSIVMKPNFYDLKKGQVIAVDYGNHANTKQEGDILKSADGTELKFTSSMHVVNYMASQGWILMSSTPINSDQFTAFGKTTIVVERSLFLFRRKVQEKEISKQ